MWFHFRSGMRPRPPNTCLIHTGKLSLHLTSSKNIHEMCSRMARFSEFVFQPLPSGPGVGFPPALGHRRHWQLGEWQAWSKWEVISSLRLGLVVEVGCPPERAPEGGHPIPFICRDRKTFVRGNKMEEKERKNNLMLSWQVYGFLLAVGLELVWEIIGKNIPLFLICQHIFDKIWHSSAN